MPIFKYTGLNSSGKEVKSTINSETIYQAKSKIKSEGIMLVKISEQKSGMDKTKSTFHFGGSISTLDLALMTRQLATLTKAKIQLVEALKALVEQSDNPQMKIILSEVRQKVNEGSSFAKALANYPKVFSNVYINMVDAGEASGTLDIVLLRLADFNEAKLKLSNKIKSAMTYPLIMVIFGSIMMGIIFIVVIPKITKIFISMKKELPIPTKISIWISDFLQNYWWGLLIGLFLFYQMFRKYIKTKEGKSRWDKFLVSLPVVGKLTIMINISIFCSTLATLLNSGVPILISMKIVKNLISNVHMQQAVENSRISVSEGAGITGPLIQSGFFPPMVTHMIGIGEKTGELEPMLKIIAENYEEQVNSKLSGLTSILEPIMLICMGVAVAFIVFSVVMPLLELNKL